MVRAERASHYMPSFLTVMAATCSLLKPRRLGVLVAFPS